MATHASKRKREGKSKPTVAAPAWYERDWLVFLLLAIATIAVFSPAFASEFVSWDDNLNVSKNAFFNPPTLGKVAHFWKTPFLDLYVPITYSVWGLLAAVAWMPAPDAHGIQLDPSIFHATNVFIHLASVWIVYALLRRLVKMRWPAAAGALLFALHPLQVEPVAWVTGLKDVLCGALSLAALWQYVAYAQADQDDRSSNRKWVHYAAAMFCFALAVLAKPSAVVVPAAALILDFFIVGRRRIRSLAMILPMALMAGAWMVLSVKFQTVVAPAVGRHVLLRPLIATDALAFYAYKLIFPVWLGFHYHRSPLTVIRGGWLYYTWVVPAAILGAAIVIRKRAPWALPALALFVIAVGPVLGLVPFSFQRYATVADRYLYLAMFGPAFALAGALAMLAARSADRSGASASRTGGAVTVVGVVLMLLGVRSFMQTLTWRDNATLFANALIVNPRSAAAYDGLAAEEADQKHVGETPDVMLMRLSRAKALAERGAELAPDQPEGYVTLGTIYNMRSEVEKAAAGIEKDHDPQKSGVELEQATADAAKSIEAFRKAVAIAPDKPQALNGLGGALGASASPENLEEAETLLRRALKYDPTLAQAHLNLGMILLRQHHKDEAFEETETAVTLDGGDPRARTNLAMYLLARGDREEAKKQVDVALQIDPDYRQAQIARQVITNEPR